MASPSELSLDCKPYTNSMLLKSVREQTDQPHNLEEFLSRLEEERLKIDAFKRELPLCMQLLTNAVETSRQQLQTYRANQGPRLEEFIPLKDSNCEGSEKASALTMSDNKANWMTSAQLWSQGSVNDQGTNNQISMISPVSPKERDITFNKTVISPKLEVKPRNGGAFLPFSKEKNSNPTPLYNLPDLALSSAEKAVDDKYLEGNNSQRRENSAKPDNGGSIIDHGKEGGDMTDNQIATAASAPSNSQGHRKARRCWSPDLHRRFVNALQMLGGSQVATPKQIRELMKVDGLTNDEVKSHLQKYRLHTRRPSPSPQATGNPQPQLVVLGGIWVPPEYAASAPPALYGPHPNAQYCTQQVPQELYSGPQLHHHTLHQQLQMYKSYSQSQASPESNGRVGTGDQSESIEDGKSESGSWKAESGGENGGDRNVHVLVAK